jgi:hypothetical protein
MREDSPFFPLLGSAPQWLNDIRPEAKPGCGKLRAEIHTPHTLFIIPLFALAVEALVTALYPRMAIVPPIRTIFSLTCLVVADT